MSNPTDSAEPIETSVTKATEPSSPKPKHPNRQGWKQHKLGCQCRSCSFHRPEEARIARERSTSPLPPRDPKTGEVIHVDDHNYIIAPGMAHSLNSEGRARAIIARWLEIRTLNPNLSNPACAEMMQIHKKTLERCIRAAVREGWLKFDDPLDRIQNEIIPKTIDNLKFFLDAKDRIATLETAKNTIFKVYQESQGVAQAAVPTLALQINMTQPDSASKDATTFDGTIIGIGKSLKEE